MEPQRDLCLASVGVSPEEITSRGQRSQYVGAFPGYFHCVPAGVVDVPDLLHIVQKDLSPLSPELGWLRYVNVDFLVCMFGLQF